LPEQVRDPEGLETNAIPQKSTMERQGGKPGTELHEKEIAANLGRCTSEKRKQVKSRRSATELRRIRVD